MQRFECWVCGGIFDEESAAEQREIHNEVHPHFVEKFMACPFCGSVYYEDYEGDEDAEED